VVGEDFNPLAIGGDGRFDMPLAFAGYGITAPEADYDDYAGVDVAGKAVIILRHEPQQANPDSAFNGADHSRHAPFTQKLSNAVEHGAAAVVFVTDKYEIDTRLAQADQRIEAIKQRLAELKADDPESTQARRAARMLQRFFAASESGADPLLGFKRAGDSAGRDLPVLCIRREWIDKALAAAGKPSLAELESAIDEDLRPRSFTLNGVRLAGDFTIDRNAVETVNVAAVMPGVGDAADEVLVIGAHYDHLGRGGVGSLEPGSSEVHNGADDNASGTTALIEAARLLAERGPFNRTVVFVAFTGEERGLLGSAEYVRNPPYPLEKTVAMLNFDMVGRLAEDRLIVNGTGTAESFDAMIDRLNETHQFRLTKSPGGFGPSDHASFYGKKIPVLHFFTDLHDEYHRPDDDYELLNAAGIGRIAALAVDAAEQIANASERVRYVDTSQGRVAGRGRGARRPFFGSVPDANQPGGGYVISAVTPDGPAEAAGVQAGDKVVRLNGQEIGSLEDFASGLAKFAAGDRVKVVVARVDAAGAASELEVEVVLGEPR
ncbi:MAG: M28 family peptidase, partial [Planctomycetota bacterium]